MNSPCKNIYLYSQVKKEVDFHKINFQSFVFTLTFFFLKKSHVIMDINL